MAATIRSERARLHWTQDQLAESSGLSKSTIVRFENGTRAPDTDQLAQLGAVFGLTVSEILAKAEALVGRQAGRQAGLAPEDVTAGAAPDEAEPAARLRDVVTHSETTSSGVPSPDELEELARRAAEEIKNAKRVKRGRRTGDRS